MENNFDHNYQNGIISLLISDPGAFSRCRNILKEEYFESSLKPVIRFVTEYADKHGILPIPELIKTITGRDFVLVPAAHEHEAQLLQEVEQFCRYRAIENVILGGMDLLDKGAHGEIERQIKDALTISLITDLGSDYYRTTKERMDRIKNRSNMVSTGWTTIDRKLYGGFTRGSLNIYAGGSGSGKSLFLQNSALNWSFAGLNVIYITLELSEDLVGNRMDAMISGMSTKEIFQKSDELVFRMEKFRQSNKPGSLHVKKMPEGGTNSSDIRAYLKEYQIKTGVRPDGLIIDYLDLLYPNNNKIDATNSFAKDKYVSEELRAVAGEWDFPVVTASQLNRQSVEAQEFDHSHIAGGISKINTADNVFGIFTSTSMRESGRYQLQFLKTRSSSAVGSKIDLAYDPSTMRITDQQEEDRTDEEEAQSRVRNQDTGNAAVSTSSQMSIKEPASGSKIDSLFEGLRNRT